jgi:branched-chain amino acid transport system ATP-binding protein
MSELLEITGLCKHFGGLRAVNEVSFTVGTGEILGLIGPNGAGKSTLFNLINGVLRPSAGRVRFSGTDITGWAPYRVVRLGLARTHQIVRPLNDMTVLENCTVGACFGSQALGLGPARRVADEVLELVGLADRRHQLAAGLTIAGKKRLEVARALSARPKLLLFDEVLAGLNPTEVGRMIEVFRAIRAQGIAIVMIEHLMQAIMNLSDRVVVLNFGGKIAEGRPHEVATDPTVVEAYLGDPNIAARLAEPPGGAESPGREPPGREPQVQEQGAAP